MRIRATTRTLSQAFAQYMCSASMPSDIQNTYVFEVTATQDIPNLSQEFKDNKKPSEPWYAAVHKHRKQRRG